MEEAVVLYSGGTDSTCAAAIMAERFQRLHLLTFDRYGFHHVERSRDTVEALARRFPDTEFVHRIVRVEKLFAHLAYRDYLSRLRRFGFRMLQNCTFCALAHHLRALAWCQEHGIRHVADGVTRELQYLPSHMEKPLGRLREYYASFGIEYHTPVYDFDVPPEIGFFDKVFLPEDGDRGVAVDPGLRTPGRYLHELGLLPQDNIKGSALDRRRQYRCFQYVINNLVAFHTSPTRDYGVYEQEILAVYEDSLQNYRPDPSLLEGEKT